jgi:HNH endonuclease
VPESIYKSTMPNALKNANNRCIFCGSTDLPSKQPEHVMLNAMGGRVTRQTLDCDNCNRALGSGPDAALANAVAPIRNLMGFDAGDGDAAPMLRNLPGVDGRHYDLPADGSVVETSTGKLIDRSFDGEGRWTSLSLKAQSIQHASRLLPHARRAINATATEMREIVCQASVEIRYDPSPTLTIGFAFYKACLRSMAKTCMLLWAMKVGNEEVLRPEYNLARAFVRHGDGHDGFIAHLDPRSPPQEYGLQAFGQFHNCISVASDAAGRVLGYFRLYGLVGYAFVLAQSGGVASQSTSLASDPGSPVDYKLDTLNIPFS